ncbi:sensor histidine kinase [Flaviaesturariibacter flavus]|uniref:Sensor histidine kinase n=1 Tax=Flaviaesturariibacter flavus TaxID=2502780 RepID=A0A4R1BKD5_9BACT|nr:GAF domain-containing protein [Flaviaesturariibacter flavus]TCJ17794.1 sensor histidine kinase [Flaviaesturariibacter flavus]
MDQFSENERVAALQELHLLDSEPESEFNDLVSLAADLCQAPISLLTLLDEKRQWFKAARGTSLRETDRSNAFCNYALLQEDIFVVNDATQDPRFAANPYVLGDPNIRFYAGALIHSPGGARLGTLCIIDSRPRELTWKEASILEKLARQATALIELRSLRLAVRRQDEEQRSLREQANSLRRHVVRLTELERVQQANAAALIDNGMDALRQSRFSKKEVAEINTRAALHRAQITAFTESLSRISQAVVTGPVNVPETPVAPLCATIFQELAPLLRERGSRLSPLVPAGLSIRQDPADLELILRNALRALISLSEKTEISFLVQAKSGGVEFLMLLTEQNITDTLQRFFTDPLTPGIEHLTGKPFHTELALTCDLVELIGGNLSVQKLGNRGSSLAVFLPDRAAG